MGKESMSIARQFALLLAALLIAGCGGGSPEPEAFSPQAMAAAQTSAVTAASVTSATAAELLMNTAEAAYPTLFPGHKVTQTLAPFAYRHYPETGMYLGVVVTASGAYALNGVYLVGTGYGTLASPRYMGLLTDYVAVTIDPGITYKHLLITVNVAGYGSYQYDAGSVAAPVTQIDFCGALSTDPIVQQALSAYGASFTLTQGSCSFNGTSASFAGTVSVQGYGSVSFSVTYSYV
jgi:hypothetical protein